MKQKFRLYRGKGSGRYYVENNATGQQESLGTWDRTEALRLICAKNEAEFQPAFNAHLARTYLSVGDPEIAKRNWQWVMDMLVRSKVGLARMTQERYASSIAEKALDPIRTLSLIETRPEHFQEVMLNGTVSTNVFLRRLQSYAVGMKWLQNAGLCASMSRKGNCYDNASIESFWSTLKLELVYRRDFVSRHQARIEIFDYIECFYNPQRSHSSLNFRSPVDFELKNN